MLERNHQAMYVFFWLDYLHMLVNYALWGDLLYYPNSHKVIAISHVSNYSRNYLVQIIA